eukprot:TRINITY_DN58401_c0_g1_i1.p1 TRINITY_DN58401_c0_g1~~TRINITY_DN58401_c0_g1_i1.p1  ORF type:complete len:293 (-),score=25.45 TRINITY_DN58401_c0_g1_i1:68-946(-)
MSDGASDAATQDCATCLNETPIQIIDPQSSSFDLLPQSERLVLGSSDTPIVGRVVHQDPLVEVFPGFLTSEETDTLVGLGEGRWFRSPMYRGLKTEHPGRTSSSCYLSGDDVPEHPLVQAIEQRCCKLAEDALEHLEGLVLLRYLPGQRFDVHHDGAHRNRTIFLYLNDLIDEDQARSQETSPAGGETLFPKLGIKITPRRGCAVMWQNSHRFHVADRRVDHVGLPPQGDAVKYGMNVFFSFMKQEWRRKRKGSDSYARLDGQPCRDVTGALHAALGDDATCTRKPQRKMSF